MLVNAFKPVVKAINAAMSHIIAFAKTISNALGQIFGWKYEESGGGIAQDFEDAADASDGMASGTGETLDNLKKMQKYIAPWHEVNNMTTDAGDSGAGGGSGGGGIGGGAGVGSGDGWVKGDSILKAFESEIDTLYKLGKHISDTLSDVMEGINWNKVYEKARNFGKGLAEFLNGLINPRLFGNIGKTIAGALNTVVYSALSFGLTFDFVNLGESIAEGVNQFFATFDFGSLAETINVWANGILDTAIIAIRKTDWGQIGKKIGDFLAEIDFIEIGKRIGSLLWEGINAGIKLLASSFQAAPIEMGIVSLVAIPKILDKITNSKYIKNLKNLGKAFDVVKKAFDNFKFGLSSGNVLTGIDRGLSTIRENLTGVQKGVIVASSAFAEFNVVSDTMKGLMDGTENVAVGIAKIGTSVAAAGVAMYTALGPAGLLVTAIAGVGGALSAMHEKMEEETQIAVFGDKLSNISSEIQETTNAVRERTQASREYIESAGIAETAMAKDLADRYFNLAEKQNLTNQETEEMKRLADLLVDKMPELQQYYDEQTGLINATRQSVQELIQERLKEIQLNAVEEQLTQAYKDQFEQMGALKKAADEANNAQSYMNELNQEYENLQERIGQLQTYEDLGNQINNCSGNTEELLKKQDELWNEITEGGAQEFPTIDSLNQKMGEVSQKIYDFRDEYNQTMSDFASADEVYEGVQTNISELTNMYVSGMGEAAGEGIDNFNNVMINDSSIEDSSIQLARDAVNGYTNELSNESNLSKIKSGAGAFIKAGLNAMQEEQDSHSPSKVTQGFGKDAVDGYRIGIKSNTGSVLSVASSFIKNVVSKFSEIISPLREIGQNAMSGLYNGLSSMANTIYSKASEIANNVTNVIKNVLQIHSPSKVMFKLGDFTMQGFKEGIESLYNPISNSVKTFSYDVALAPNPGIIDMYSGYRNRDMVYTPQYGIAEYPQNSYGQSNAETNNLLRRQNELLERILAKPNLSNQDVFDAAQTVYKGKATRRYGNSSYFDPVWG